MATGKKAAVGAGVALAAVTAAVVVTKGMGGGSAGLATDISAEAAARFLTQTTFGVTDAEIADVQTLGFAGWIDAQMAMTPFSMLKAVRARIDEKTGQKPYRTDGHGAFVETFWTGALTRPDQLRQRMQFALSQIFVVTRETEELEFNGSLATTNYYDLLGANAFKNWRDLIEIVTLNPMVGIFLSYVTNDKEDPATGRTPDENYARELMQLFSIGTVLLNQDGTPQLDANGATIPTYSHDGDIAGLAKVFTGISWFSPAGPNESSWLSSAFSYFNPPLDVGDSTTTNTPVQMMYYPNHHSTSEKRFLGVTIPASATPNPAGDVKIALDTIFHHQNTAPYFAKRLIQQFVTSNPSPDYVRRIADVFDNNGQGVRGDIGAVLKAILLDAQARDDSGAQADPNFGKLREPMIRLTNWGRTFKATSKRGHFSIGETGAPDSLNQGILDAPSVFNFWRAGYVPPHTRMGNQGLMAPEFQVVTELTTASWINMIHDAVASGAGFDEVKQTGTDVIGNYATEAGLASTPSALVDRLNTLLFYGQMSAALRQQITAAVTKVNVGTATKPLTAAQLQTALTNRAKLAIVLSMVSGEYLVQR
jgi:uncharacterized protein (DUF1800 family)